jgi:hypothetical protein
MQQAERVWKCDTCGRECTPGLQWDEEQQAYMPFTWPEDTPRPCVRDNSGARCGGFLRPV